MNEKLIQVAIDESKKSDGKQQIGCIITDKKGKVISSGYNKPTKSHPFQDTYATKAGRPEKIYLHAEIDALVKCRIEPHTIYIGRELKFGGYGMSKPCPICELAIRESGIIKIVYTTEEGIVEWKLNS